MCNLYRLKAGQEPQALVARLALLGSDTPWPEDWVSPFTRPWMPVILNEPRQTALGSWTLMPPWVDPADEAAVKKQSRMTANARSETMFTLASFRDAARRRRCLVPATAFREWQWQDPAGKKKIPHDIGLAGGRPFLMAGLWSEWRGQLTFTIVTKAANTLMARIHNGVRAHSGQVEPRMPVFVPEDQADLWLTPGPPKALAGLFEPRDDDGLGACRSEGF